DEKCTITRPGISHIASALAVEFYVDIVRGTVTHHQMRFKFSDMKLLHQETHKNPTCSCCSTCMLTELVNKGYGFVEETKWDPSMLDDITGFSLDDADNYDVQSIDEEEI